MPKLSGHSAEAADRRAFIVEQRRKHIPFEQIAQQLGITNQRVHQIYTDALRSRVALAVDQHREESLRVIDDTIIQLQAIVDAPPAVSFSVKGQINIGPDGEPVPDHAQRLQAAEGIRRWEERKSRLLGLDAPTKVEQETHVTYEVTGAEDI